MNKSTYKPCLNIHYLLKNGFIVFLLDSLVKYSRSFEKIKSDLQGCYLGDARKRMSTKTRWRGVFVVPGIG